MLRLFVLYRTQQAMFMFGPLRQGQSLYTIFELSQLKTFFEFKQCSKHHELKFEDLVLTL